MEKLLYLTIAFLCCWSCHQEEAFQYANPRGGIQFDYQTMVLNYDFAFQQDKEGKYLGDSLRADTLKIALAVVGYSAAYDRTVILDTVSVIDQEVKKGVRLTFLTPYVFGAHRFNDTVEVVVHRPANRGKFAVGLTFDWEMMLNEFEQGVKEKLVCRLNVTDSYPEPENWNKKYFGEYSEEKYAFYVTVIGDRYEHFKVADGLRFNRLLREALKVFNRENPDARKEFSFPEDI